MRLVLVLGVRKQMDRLLLDRGILPRFAGGFRVSDGDVLTAAAEATGAARTEVEAALSKVFIVGFIFMRPGSCIRSGCTQEVPQKPNLLAVLLSESSCSGIRLLCVSVSVCVLVVGMGDND